MKLIDFDGQFRQYMERWMADNRGKYKNAARMEEAIPEVYLRWLNAPADWLGGATPGGYFARYDDPLELVEGLRAYVDGKVSVPDGLMERIAELGEPAVAHLMAAAADEAADGGLRVTALNLLREIGTAAPMAMCLSIVEQMAPGDEVADVAVEALTDMGRAVVAPILERFEGAGIAAREAFLDILCNFPGDERIYTYAVQAFERGDNRALYASYLGKLGDDRAIEPLTQSLSLPELAYLDYIEIVNAIEALGGEVSEAREFAGDPQYESLKDMR
ncbi:MAG: hypothetical protein GX558_10575 [Clostridiales bacterium]|nr:hypothetical protein [Clostridiales bacterium]